MSSEVDKDFDLSNEALMASLANEEDQLKEEEQKEQSKAELNSLRDPLRAFQNVIREKIAPKISSESVGQSVGQEQRQSVKRKPKGLDFNNLKIDIVEYKRIEASSRLEIDERLVFIVEVASPPYIPPKQSEVHYVDFLNVMNDLITAGYRFLSIQDNINLEIADTFDNDQVQAYLVIAREILWEIQGRKDLLCLEIVRQLLGLGEDITSIQADNNHIIPGETIERIQLMEEELEVSGAVVDFAKDITYVSLQNLTPLSRLGRIWSIIESQVLGGIFAIKKCIVSSKLEYLVVAKRYYEFRVLCIAFCEMNGLILLGSHAGNLHYHESNSEEPIAKKMSTVSIGNEAIIAITIFQKKYALLTMPSGIKVFDLESKQIVQGGSVKKRLIDEELVSAEVYPDKMLLFLGTSMGSVLVFKFSLEKLDYITTFKFQQNESVSSMISHSTAKGEAYLFAAQGGVCTVQKMTRFVPDLRMQQNAQFDMGKYVNCEHNNFKLVFSMFIAKHSVFISGTDKGMVVCWSSKNGAILSAQQITQNYDTILSILFDPTQSHLMILTKDSLTVLKMVGLDNPALHQIGFDTFNKEEYEEEYEEQSDFF